MLDSEAVLSVPVEARWLFVTIMLSADDVGLFEATEFRLGRRADVGRDSVGRLMQMLADVDLIRLYVVDGKRYGFIPRFRQRVQIKSTRHPLPPRQLMLDDSDATKKINDLASETTVGAPVGSGCATDGHPSEAEAEAKERQPGQKNSSSSPTPRRQKSATGLVVPNCPVESVVAAYHEVLPEWPRARVLREPRRKAIKALWTWVLTSTKTDGARRAESVDQGVQWFRAYFERARANDFLMGRTSRSAEHADWQPDIDYLCSDKGLKQVIEKTKDSA